MSYKCQGCGEPLRDNLEEVLTVTVMRTSRIRGIEYESEDCDVVFDYNPDLILEEDLDVDTPAIYQCGYCGREINKATVIEVLHEGDN